MGGDLAVSNAPACRGGHPGAICRATVPSTGLAGQAAFKTSHAPRRRAGRDSKRIAMSSIATDLADALGTIDRPGDFFASGTVELLTPRLEVDGVGLIALPLLPVQAEQLIAAAERAPFGRGEDTLTDLTVRRTWQIGPEHVRIGGRHWSTTLETILARATEGLGVTGPVAAEFYKLLVYDHGSFFVRHRDTEKLPGMFATLILVLPSLSAGGELVVRHKDREARLGLHCEDPSEVAFAAFYADCVHEVLPVAS